MVTGFKIFVAVYYLMPMHLHEEKTNFHKEVVFFPNDTYLETCFSLYILQRIRL